MQMICYDAGYSLCIEMNDSSSVALKTISKLHQFSLRKFTIMVDDRFKLLHQFDRFHDVQFILFKMLYLSVYAFHTDLSSNFPWKYFLGDVLD